jgi:hypothetical protein
MTESVVVGRKTPGDGRVEVSPHLAATLGGDGRSVTVRIGDRALTGEVQVLQCTCAKAGVSGKHAHHFVQCDAFRDLEAGTPLTLTAEPSHLDVAL